MSSISILCPLIIWCCFEFRISNRELLRLADRNSRAISFWPPVFRQDLLGFVLQDAPNYVELDVHLFTQLFDGVAPRRLPCETHERLGGGTDDEPLDMGSQDRPSAHGARVARSIERAILQGAAFQVGRCRADGHGLSVTRRVA